MRLFGSDSIRGIMDRLGVDEDEPIESPLVSRAIESAQRKVESRNFEARKNVLDYDDVMNQQREVIYAQRRRILEETDVHPIVEQMVEDVVKALVGAHCPDNADPEDWDRPALLQAAEQFFLPPGGLTPEDLQGEEASALQQALLREAAAAYAEREGLLGAEGMRDFERQVLLQVVNMQWVEHLEAMDDLREGINLRAYGQLDPLTQYKIEAYEMFEELVGHIREETVRLIYLVHVVQLTPEQQAELERQQALPQGGGGMAWPGFAEADGTVGGSPPELGAPGPGGAGPEQGMLLAGAAAPSVVPVPEVDLRPKLAAVPARGAGGRRRVARNDPCPCGSGKKYKHCHGR